MFFGRTVTRVVVLGALATGGLVLLAGPERCMALFSQTRDAVNNQIDKAITDPVALRAQLRDLEATYPKRIAQVRSDLGEVRSQVQQLNREQAVSGRVVEMTTRDLETLQSLLAQAEDARAVHKAAYNPEEDGRRIELLFDDQRLTIEQALAKTIDVNNTRAAYTSRQADIERDLGYLAKQEERLSALLTKLETERGEFQAQLWQLDRQVDSIARNDRMIDVLSKRQAAIDEQSRYKAASLDHLQSKVADIRARQEAELAALASGEGQSDYEQKAKLELDARNAIDALKATRTNQKARKAQVIEIRPLPNQAKPEKAPQSSENENGSVNKDSGGNVG